MTIYLVQVSVALILFYGAYTILLKRETNFRVARLFLVFALVTSVLLPYLETEKILSIFVSDEEPIYEYWLPEIAVSTTPATYAEDTLSYWLIGLVTLYLIGVLIGLIRFLVPVIKLNTIIRNAEVKKDNRGFYYLIEGKGSFSFFNLVFLGNKSWHSEGDKEKILAHERAHANCWHSADVILVQLLSILVWFNPIIYFYRNALEQLHEYEADLIASKVQTDEYCTLLAQDALDAVQFRIVNHFNKSLTLKRIRMIKTTKNKMSVSKKTGLLISALMIIVLLACEDRVMNDMRKASKQSVLLTEYPQEVQAAIDKIKLNNPNADLQVYGLVRTKDIEDIEFEGKGATMVFVKNDPDYKLYAILGKDLVNKASEAMLDDIGEEPVFTIVEDPAEPLNGMTKFYEYIAANLLYPKEARQAGVEGRVFVRFMVDKSGKLSNFQIIRGIGMGCDEEAIRVLSTSQAWKPGMQKGTAVNSFFNMAIVFKLNADENKVDLPTVKKDEVDGDVIEIRSDIQNPPSPVGGMTEFYKYVKSTLKYPEQARRMGVEGQVFVKFVVDELGALSNFEVTKGIGAGCDAEALRVMMLSSNWNPGTHNGKAVKTIYNVPIQFKLNAE